MVKKACMLWFKHQKINKNTISSSQNETDISALNTRSVSLIMTQNVNDIIEKPESLTCSLCPRLAATFKGGQQMVSLINGIKTS